MDSLNLNEIKQNDKLLTSFRTNEMLDDFYCLQNGRKVDLQSADPYLPIHIVPRLRGGKGGFGSMLRAIGAQIEKTTNREACRDLSGRRLRDINEEKRLKKWISEQADREREAAEKKKKKIEKLKHEPKHDFVDAEYDKVRSEMVEKVFSAVEEGLKASTSSTVDASDDKPGTSQGIKRKPETKEKKKGLLWIDADDLGSDISDSDDDEEDTPKKKMKVTS